jgi:hypothetical protein
MNDKADSKLHYREQSNTGLTYHFKDGKLLLQSRHKKGAVVLG